METVTREMIEWLREKASVSIVVVEKAMLERVADMLEHYSYMNELAENRKYRKKYVEWWRKKTGNDDLTYPDFDEVYKDFWELMDKLSMFDVTEVRE